MAEKYLGLKFDPDAMIRILGVQLYDTPWAMLRENVQNAYDAILERMQIQPDFKDGRIDVEIVGDHITISDNGIGMDEDGLQKNYWTAGHSGKNTQEARIAGVVGHFGIGALANFGVCSRIEINTMRYGISTRYLCIAERDKLDGKQFPLEEQEDLGCAYGTKIGAILQPDKKISIEDAQAYLGKYVQFLPIPVFFNNVQYPQKTFTVATGRANSHTIAGDGREGIIRFKFVANFLNYQPLKPEILISEIFYNDQPVIGSLFLTKDTNEIFGFNNGFGISRIHLISEFGFGGYANFSFLEPTAGREAVSRSSTQYLQQILYLVESFWAKKICAYDVSDSYREFLLYVNTHFSLDLAKYVKIKYEEVDIPLGDITPDQYSFYAGNNTTTRKSLYSSGSKVLIPSQEMPRRSIQINYLRTCGVEEKKDQIVVTPITSRILPEELLLLEDIKKVIEDDYIIHDVDVQFADITLGVTVRVVANEKQSFTIYLTRDNSEIKHLIETQYNFNLYFSLVKDYVRIVLYNQFVDFIPKDQKERAAYINEAMERKREELEYEYSDVSELREALRMLDEGKIKGDEFIARARKARVVEQEQVLDGSQVGDVGAVVKTADAANGDKAKPDRAQEEQFLYVPQPPILELDESTEKKILTASDELATLHGHKMFLAVYPKFNKAYRSFMLFAHSTKVIWSMHRIIYIFSDQTNKTALYYELALLRKLDEKNTGGQTLVSTTIITKNTMFIPVPSQLYEYFSIKKGSSLKFLVHFEKVNG